MPIIYALGIGMFLLSIKHKIGEVWNTLVIVFIWLNIGALLWRFFPQLHPLIVSGWDKIFAPVAPILHPIFLFLQNVVVNFLKVLAGLEVH